MALQDAGGYLPDGRVSDELLIRGFNDLATGFDPVHGGFGRAPKFPMPVMLLYLLRYWMRTGSADALQMVTTTLDALRCGGIHDHLGGGFHRYSTDPGWQVPHFEKMLYDQALLLAAFTEAWLATGKPEYRTTAEDIIAYILSDLQSPEGGFFCAEDADNAGGEGAFYVWTRDEFDQVLGKEDGAYAAGVFGVHGPENFIIPEGSRKAHILFLPRHATDQKSTGESSTISGKSRHRQIPKKLLDARDRRPRPGRDEKILTDWNGLAIAALAGAYRAFGDPQYLVAAERAMALIQLQLHDSNGGLLHRYCDGEAAIHAFADDYAFILRAFIALYESTFNPAWLREAITLDRYFTRNFHDNIHGGYFSTSGNHDPLIVRKKEFADGVIPSSNSVMLENLVLLGHLTGDPVYHERAFSLAKTMSGLVGRSPSAYPAFLGSLGFLLGPATDILIAGKDEDPAMRAMIAQVWQVYLPYGTVICRTPDAASSGLDELAPFSRVMIAQDGKATAYVCYGTACHTPVTRPEDLALLIAPENKK
ncbi:MAG: AGE family epimerase/isomerase [Methanoregula sp.]|jgi:hypothetical protein|nr:AGE family epimerase/isomerase [Methanoregula sp.]